MKGLTTSPDPAAADALHVRCDRDGIEVLTPVVKALPDGLHVLADIEGLVDPEIQLRSVAPSDRLSAWWSGSSGVNGEFVRTVPPGLTVVRCESGPNQGDGPEELEATFEIVDADAVAIDYSLGCSSPEQIANAEGLSVQAENLDGAVRRGVVGVLHSDLVEEAGYLGSDSAWRVARVLRDGEIVAAFVVDGRTAWAWRVIHGIACPTANLGPVIAADEFPFEE